MGRVGWSAIGIFCLAMAGCAGNDPVLRKQVEMEGALERLTQQNAALDYRVAELARSLKELQQKSVGAAADLQSLRGGWERSTRSLESVQVKLAQLEQVPAGAGALPVGRDHTPASRPDGRGESVAAPGSPQEGYRQALAKYHVGNLSGALEGFDALVQADPKGALAPNALYWSGECHYRQQKYGRALSTFTRVVSDYPKAPKAPDAMLKMGFALIAMNNMAQAKTTLKGVVEKYPESQAAAKARERLGRL